MKKNTPTLEEWRTLYDVATRLKKLAPWEWMEESEVFGVQNPKNKEPGFVSVMGKLGEHLAISVYMGASELYKFWELEDAGPSLSPEHLLEIRQLQVSFEERDALEKEDYAVVKKLGLRFRGKQNWPLFRSLQPGCLPWLINVEEAQFLFHVIEQTIEVATRFRHDKTLLTPPDDASYLVRVATEQDGILVWEDQMMTIEPPEEDRVIPGITDARMFEALQKLPVGDHTLEMDLFMFPSPVMEKGTRPFFPYILLTVDSKSQMILGNEFLQPLPSLEAMWGRIPNNVSKLFKDMKALPKSLRVSSDVLAEILQPFADALPLKVRQSRRLRHLEPVKASLFEHFMGPLEDD